METYSTFHTGQRCSTSARRRGGTFRRLVGGRLAGCRWRFGHVCCRVVSPSLAHARNGSALSPCGIDDRLSLHRLARLRCISRYPRRKVRLALLRERVSTGESDVVGCPQALADPTPPRIGYLFSLRRDSTRIFRLCNSLAEDKHRRGGRSGSRRTSCR